jgi:ubiquinol-cytochrome c reductase iron-sulfur subunit
MSSSTENTTALSDTGDDGSRRDFIHLLAGVGAVAAGVAIAVPSVHQMNPDASVRALATKEVDISAIEVGQAIKVMWQGKPVFIRHRTQAEIDAARAVTLSQLKDDECRNDNISASMNAEDENRVQKAEWLVVLGVCTHLGCIPTGTSEGELKGEYNGWFCPCHGSHYDTSGRIRKGPAPQNLLVPPYEFVTDTLVKIG